MFEKLRLYAGRLLRKLPKKKRKVQPDYKPFVDGSVVGWDNDGPLIGYRMKRTRAKKTRDVSSVTKGERE